MPKRDQRWVYFVAAGANFGFSVAAGLLLGGYIDSKFDYQTPYFTVLGLVAGVISGILFLIRLLNLKNRNDRR